MTRFRLPVIPVFTGQVRSSKRAYMLLFVKLVMCGQALVKPDDGGGDTPVNCIVKHLLTPINDTNSLYRLFATSNAIYQVVTLVGLAAVCAMDGANLQDRKLPDFVAISRLTHR
jgi:hypothetical protein